MVSAHELTKFRPCVDRGCEADGDIEVEGAWYCRRHDPARRNGSARRLEPEPKAPPVAVAEPEPEEIPKCAKRDCSEPGVTRYGRALLCEMHDRERREKTRRTVRARNEQIKLASSPPIPGGLEERLAPMLRELDEARLSYENARGELRRALDEVLA